MVVSESFTQRYFQVEGSRPVSFDDVQLFLNGSLSEIENRFSGVQFMPNYVGEYLGRLYVWQLHGFIAEHDMNELQASLSVDSNDAWRGNSRVNYAEAKRLFDVAFKLSEILGDSNEQHISYDTVAEYGGQLFYPPIHAEQGKVWAKFDFELPSCSYLQFVSDGCDRLERYFIGGCLLIGQGDSENNPISGWLTSKDGATLRIATKECPQNDFAPRFILGQLLESLLNLHLHDVQLIVDETASYTLATTHALGTLWAALRNSYAEGRTRICPTCGKRFITSGGKRQERKRYCSDSCKMAFMRTKQVLSRANTGSSIEDAVSRVSGIGLKRATAISLRNRDILASQFPSVDFDALAERR